MRPQEKLPVESYHWGRLARHLETDRRPGFALCKPAAQEPLGQGAFATVKKCRLKPPAHPGGGGSVQGKSSAHSSPAKNLVAVKQLKPSVLNNETELHGFIAETDGERACGSPWRPGPMIPEQTCKVEGHVPQESPCLVVSKPLSCGTGVRYWCAVLRKLRHPAIVEFKGVGAMHAGSAQGMRRSMFLVQVRPAPVPPPPAPLLSTASCGRRVCCAAGAVASCASTGALAVFSGLGAPCQ